MKTAVISSVRPRVIINCAISVDGKMALPSRKQTRISSEEDMRRVYQLRSHCDAILVGVGTVLTDDPNLTVKEGYGNGPNPLRIVLDSHGRTPDDAKVLDGNAPTIIVTNELCDRSFKNAETLRFGRDMVDLPSLLDHLSERGVKTLLVEGGGTVIWSFLKEGLADELKVYVGSIVIGGTESPTLAGGKGAQRFEDVVQLVLERVSRLGSGVLLEYLVKR